jgi:hypothetical protein
VTAKSTRLAQFLARLAEPGRVIRNMEMPECNLAQIGLIDLIRRRGRFFPIAGGWLTCAGTTRISSAACDRRQTGRFLALDLLERRLFRVLQFDLTSF